MIALQIIAALGLLVGSVLILRACWRADRPEDLGQLSPGYMRSQGWGPNVLRFRGEGGRTPWPGDEERPGRAIAPTGKGVRPLAPGRNQR